MLRILATAALLAIPIPCSADAQASARAEPLYHALGLPELLEIMRDEGIGYGADLEQDLFPGRGAADWTAMVSEIYAIDRMEGEILAGLDAELDGAEIDAIMQFFETEDAARIVSLEVAARRAMLDEAVEDTAREAWMELEAEAGPRWDLLAEFAELNDLVESNVAGAMTSNYAFYMGLVDGEAFDFEMTEEQVLMDVWSQEQSIREETVDWVYSFTSLAYQPLSEAEFRAYIDFTATPEGKALNAALFTAFNEMFAGISHDLGLGAARYLKGQDI